jgi:hypothetical protein
MRILTRRVAALAIVSTLTLAGCGGSDSGGDDSPSSDKTSAAPAPEVEAPDGDTISGDGFEFVVPQGWQDAKASLPSALAVAVDSTDTDGFSDNVNVMADNTVVGIDRDKLEDAVEKVLSGVKATDIEIKDPVEIAGEEAVHVGARFDLNGIKYLTEQYAVGHDDKGYVVTFSFSESVPEADRVERAASVLSSWTWAD